jgi:hypothetical protein
MTQRTWNRQVGLAVGAGLITIVLIGTSAGPAIAQGVRPWMTLITNDADNPVPVRAVASSLTHVGRPVSDLVQLQWARPKGCFVETAPAFDNFETCYVPDSGRALVITDVHWNGVSFDHPAGLSVQLILHAPSGPARFTALAVVGIDHWFGGNNHLQTGFVFPPNLIVNGTLNHFVLLSGYLIPNE